MSSSYVTVTELPGELIPEEQYKRIVERYQWAAKHSVAKDVLECACGAGQGASLLSSLSKTYTAGDLDQSLVSLSKSYNPNVSFVQFDALKMPFKSESFDIVLVCEAIYYFPEIEVFLKEVNRVLRKDGKILIVSANPNLFDFNPGKLTFTYPSVVNIGQYFHNCGFRFLSAEGGTAISSITFRQKFLRPVKLLASKLGLIPVTMTGKAWLKRLFYGGKFVEMPFSIDCNQRSISLNPISLDVEDTKHKVLYFIGGKI